MKKVVLLFMLFLFSSLSAIAQTSTTTVANADKTNYDAFLAKREKFDPTKNAENDLQTAISEAQQKKKRVILDIGGEWCVWCIRMDVFIMQNAELEKLQKENFVWLKINMSQENENKEFLSKYPAATGYPHLYVLEKDGTLLKSKDTSELEEGKSCNLQKFIDFLKEYAPTK